MINFNFSSYRLTSNWQLKIASVVARFWNWSDFFASSLKSWYWLKCWNSKIRPEKISPGGASSLAECRTDTYNIKDLSQITIPRNWFFGQFYAKKGLFFLPSFSETVPFLSVSVSFSETGRKEWKVSLDILKSCL